MTAMDGAALGQFADEPEITDDPANHIGYLELTVVKVRQCIVR